MNNMTQLKTMTDIFRAEDDDPEDDATPVDVPGRRWINLNNALLRASHGLTLAERRLVYAAISKIDSRREFKPNEVLVTRVTAAEYAELSDITMEAAYVALRRASRQLYDRSITFFEPAYRRNGKPLVPTRNDIRWIYKRAYTEANRGTAAVELSWSPDLLPALVGLKKHFTKIDAEHACSLRSIYSGRLLDLLSRFNDTGWAYYDIADFCMSMEVTEKQAANFNNIKRRVIETAVNELNQKDGWKINWEPKKAGRKVTGLRFTFERNPQQRLDLEGGKTLVTGRDEGSTAAVQAMQQWQDKQREQEPSPKTRRIRISVSSSTPKPYTIEVESHSVEIIKGQTLKLPVSTTPKTRAKRGAAKTDPEDVADRGDATQVILQGARNVETTTSGRGKRRSKGSVRHDDPAAADRDDTHAARRRGRKGPATDVR